jgi:uncharacterized protein YjbJ (UPF0337 family)
MTTESTEEVDGEVKEPAGAVAGDEHLKHETGLDQVRRTLQHAVGKFVDRVRGPGRKTL